MNKFPYVVVLDLDTDLGLQRWNSLRSAPIRKVIMNGRYTLVVVRDTH